MAEADKTSEKTTSKAAKSGDAGQAEVQARMDEANEKGFFGEKVDPVPDEEYSLLTGPDAPPHVADPHTRAGTPTQGQPKE